MVNSVELTADAYLVCLTHALSTEKEEVMGLLFGEMKEEGRVAHICSAYAMRRSDKQPDRVEISPEQLSAAAIEAEVLANQLQRPIQVLGWYHSHPHITVWPSHVDVHTQASYQQLDPNFIGLIFSCFCEADKVDKKSTMQLVCFQSVNKAPIGEPPKFEHAELALRVLPTLHSTVSPMCISALTHLPDILLEEERESYSRSQLHCRDVDLLTAMHNSAVFTQSLCQILQVVCGPITQLLEEEVQRNKEALERLRAEKQRLQAILEQESDSEAIVGGPPSIMQPQPPPPHQPIMPPSPIPHQQQPQQ